jgi:hypothetical protein
MNPDCGFRIPHPKKYCSKVGSSVVNWDKSADRPHFTPLMIQQVQLEFFHYVAGMMPNGVCVAGACHNIQHW